MTIPEKSGHDGAAASKVSIPSSKSNKREAGIMKIGEAISAPIEIKRSKEEQELNRVKRQKFESDTYKALHDEYVELHE